jgi:hypothetical protein
MADVTLNRGNTVFNKREKKKIDICLLNQGGIRSTLPKGKRAELLSKSCL